jgi:FkbH-like protein
VSAFEADVAEISRVRLANAQYLDTRSAHSCRFDPLSEINFGFPYTVAHADVLGAHMASLLAPPPPKKGLITDLDDTLWLGILGEVGVDGVSWDLDHKSQIHGLYQQFLESLARAGVLIGIASKNDASLVEQALSRPDLLLRKDCVYPVEANWNAKSGAIGRILARWNINADSVVFIDDSSMEVAEVQAAFPEMECIVFPKHDARELYDLLSRLRDSFGREMLSDEDDLRLSSIRNAEALAAAQTGSPDSLDKFLAQAEAKISFSTQKFPVVTRVADLVNKTNQFNLNGVRHTEAEWASRLADPESVLVSVSYEDKYGRLGVIAALSGYLRNTRLTVDVWVMSCRAFSRRIEHACMQYLFNNWEIDDVSLDYVPTTRNAPTRDFLTSLLGSEPNGTCTITREMFSATAPPMFHVIMEAANA